MAADSADDMFKAAAKARKEEKAKQKKKKGKAAADTPAASKITLDEINEQFRRIEKQHQELKDLSEQVLQQAELSPERIKEYLTDPENFTPEQWEDMQLQREQEEARLRELQGSATARAKRKKKKVQRKMRGARRNWMKMD